MKLASIKFDDGMIMRLATTILVGVLAVSGCSKSKDDNHDSKDPIALVTPTPKPIIEAKVLPLDGVKWNSFMTVPWEKRCEGVRDVLENFQKNNLPGFVLTDVRPNGGGTPTCEPLWANQEKAMEYYNYNFRLSKDGKDLDFQLQVTAGPDLRRSAGGVHVEWKKGDSSVFVNERTVELIAIESNFQHLDKTLNAWYLKDDVEATIFGRPYSQYLSEIESTFGETGGFIWKNPNIKMKLTLDQKIPGKGTAEILEADDAAFSPGQGPLLGCNDMNCLKGSTIEFQALGTKFLLDRVISKQAGGTTLLGTWHYRVKSWPLMFE